ncbi:ATP-dependent RNA helicase DBP9 [Trichophyton rubrum D6]|uniref:RNA helicase n=2 Tax=Trichophyton TaxID=5550 RepID=A0A022VX48_TRIRU|nr:ATP-dependent RNA helicase DBP9 [Trichophyton rubrum MR850]EZF40000.1 ATP-dependent RNA helicase DBP9 [Trichophyton rubrum CBS 100081]EZF50635.1 ATP-dependent RNA helicase DBP9 [Trichophyton rubrum CBS 288.86]EZF61088.1 ATP-dependent RNA helicase DBP9 [Trichophyton rubrum CBS 289.86]EZF71860.1 ATP-dependent RNA helicase DBP9 [Trichophyton soudanense CBS 452.61]EZF82558.1 ATP-dependent RNA helicase DBP9 [Trichophyton rubrum MR1448]EZF93230.1 ATP-dependent RNA helicase DBP9 [Trichophyton rub
MKRKLDENDVPTSAETTESKKPARHFEDFGLDPRLLQALTSQKFSKPTLVQAEAIPLALSGKDILARAKTGSGKTAAYLIPIIQKILQKKAVDPAHKSISTLILVPTRELAQQVHKTVTAFSEFCSKDIRSGNLTQKVSDAVQRALLADLPDIVISTPARAIVNVNNSALALDTISQVVIDEADLVLSYGYEQDMQNLAKAIPRGVQTFLMSATLTSEVDTLKGLFCRSPAILKLEEAEDEGAGISQFAVKCAEDDKFLLTYVIFKLQLVKGKCIIFVGDVDRCYRLKLFLEQFGIKSCILNSELPANSRIHAVEEFNKGVYDIIIAADDQEVIGKIESKKETSESEVPITDAATEENKDLSEPEEVEEKLPPSNKKKRKKSEKEKDYGISRGIDFQDVACVLNFDLPTTAKSYTHRIGRTGRAGKTGMALSFVVPSELYGKHKPTIFPPAKNDESVLAKIEKRQAKMGREVKPYHFDKKQIEVFRYRMTDALRAVTRIAVQEARAKEIRQELVKSEKLKRHFEENPQELRELRHDQELGSVRVQSQLKNVPEYLMPTKGKSSLTSEDIGFVGLHKKKENRIRQARQKNRARGRIAKKGRAGRKIDPLKSFKSK